MTLNSSTLWKEVLFDIDSLLANLDFTVISEINPLYEKYVKNKYHYFVKMEFPRYLEAIKLLEANGFDFQKNDIKIHDFGCMVPILPHYFAKLGCEVHIIDCYNFYGKTFYDEILRFSAKSNLVVHDVDIVNDDLCDLEGADLILNMAVVEHLNGSPISMLRKIGNTAKPAAKILFDVPNIASLVKRVRLLLGYSPLDDYHKYVAASYPYMGHNREMTVDEVTYLFKLLKLDVTEIYTFNFNKFSTNSFLGKTVRYLGGLNLVRNSGENIICLGQYTDV